MAASPAAATRVVGWESDISERPTDPSRANTIDAFRHISRPRTDSDLLIHVAMPTRITVIYDETCELCRHARRWLEGQRTYIPLDFLAAGQARITERFAGVPWLGEELVVVADDGRVWVGPSAFITAMWTTRKFRGWSYRLSGDTFSGMARHFFHTLTTERGRISALLSSHRCDGESCQVEPSQVQPSQVQPSQAEPSQPDAAGPAATAGTGTARSGNDTGIPTWPSLSDHG